MAFSKISGLLEANLIDRKVLARIDPAQLAQPLELAVGDASVTFEPANDVQNFLKSRSWPFRSDSGSFDLQVRGVANGEPAEDAVQGSINTLSDWALNGAETVQVMIRNRNNPVTIEFVDPVSVSPSDKPKFLKALIAAHRAFATLVVKLIDGDTGEPRWRAVDIPC
jgi:hypothetical protein